MKKTILLFLSALVLISCTKTPQEKAEALIKEYLEKALNFPKSYEPLTTKLDSVFNPNGPELFDLEKVFVENLEKYDRAVEEAKQAESTMSIYSHSYMSEFSKVQYAQAKEEYEAAQKKIKRIEKKCKDNIQELDKIIENNNHDFRCMIAEHHFRAQNNGGNVMTFANIYFFDKDLTKITNVYSSADLIEIKMMEEKIEDYVDLFEKWREELKANKEE